MPEKFSERIATLLRLASLVICLIVIASFTIFAVDKANGASSHQQAVLNGTAAAPGAPGSSEPEPHAKPAKESSVHKAIDDAASELTSPFAGLASKLSSEWLGKLVETALALIVYGFGLGYLARVLRVRT